VRPPCAVCGGKIPAPYPDQPDEPDAWHTSFLIAGIEHFVHYRCFELHGPLGSRMFAAAKAAS
jgi:hypothetical protein